MDELASLGETPESAIGNGTVKFPKNDALVMTVDIGDGRQDVLVIKPTDDPGTLAAEFTAKHGLNADATALLTDLVRQHKESAQKKRQTGEKTKQEQKSKVSDFKPKARLKAFESSSKSSVYDRLYQRKKKPEAEKPRSASVTSRQNGSTFNYGEWLYIKGVQSREALKRSAETKKKEEVESTERDLTFRPSINRKSALLSPRYNMRTEDLLLQKEASKREKLEEMKTQTEQERLRECSFTPKISIRSQQLDMSRSSNASTGRFADLFQEAAKRKERQIEREYTAATSEFSFKPAVHSHKGEAVDKEAFLERIVNSKKRFEEEMEKIRREMVTDVDETGHKLFEPDIPKDPRFERHLDGAVHDRLYALKDQKKQSVERLAQELDENIRAAQRSTKVTQQSERILENFRRKAYEGLFKLLDSDGDGVINAEACMEDALENKTREILEPVLNEIRESESVDFAAFHGMMDRLMGRLPLDSKSHILRRESKPEEPATSNAKMSQRSLSVKSDLLASKRRESLPGDIYTRRVSEKRQTEEKVERLKQSLELRAMQQCTFKPFTTRGKARREK